MPWMSVSRLRSSLLVPCSCVFGMELMFWQPLAPAVSSLELVFRTVCLKEYPGHFQQHISEESTGNFWCCLGAQDMDLAEEKEKEAGAKSCTALHSLCCGFMSTWKNLFVQRYGGLLNFTASAIFLYVFFFPLFCCLQLCKHLCAHFNLLWFFCPLILQKCNWKAPFSPSTL